MRPETLPLPPGLPAPLAEAYRTLSGWLADRLQEASGCHDLDHTLRVISNSCALLAELPEADPGVVLMAALLHDAARPEEMRSKGALDHALIGAELAEQELQKAGLPQEFAERVAEAIRTHRFRRGAAPSALEAKIVYDADKLDSLGAVGIGRAFLFAGRVGARLHNTEAEALAGSEYTREDTAYREYLVKLRHVPGRMATLPGARMAGERAAQMAAFFSELDRETGLNGG